MGVTSCSNAFSHKLIPNYYLLSNIRIYARIWLCTLEWWFLIRIFRGRMGINFTRRLKSVFAVSQKNACNNKEALCRISRFNKLCDKQALQHTRRLLQAGMHMILRVHGWSSKRINSSGLNQSFKTMPRYYHTRTGGSLINVQKECNYAYVRKIIAPGG